MLHLLGKFLFSLETHLGGRFGCSGVCGRQTLLDRVSADSGSQGGTSLRTIYYMLSFVLANKFSKARAPAILIHVLKSKQWPCRKQ